MLIFILTILLTQAFSTFIALFMMIGLYTVTNVNLKSIKTFTLDLFTKWYFWLGLGVIVYKAADFYNRNYELIRVMSEVLVARVSGLLNTFFST
ncbi:MAG: hypothetical protein QMB24_13350, partial [Spirosomataceae bacterium]